ncbi:MAG: hypothetical protein DME44_00280 [Verrucomicrobia bacterium]|nr:MAG: hypothetical protein DME44_00280 [Verrucomicrobiota bacterium]
MNFGVSVAEVKANFERFDLLDERTRFVEGWFRDTIPKAKVDSISVLRFRRLRSANLQSVGGRFPRKTFHSLADHDH